MVSSPQDTHPDSKPALRQTALIAQHRSLGGRLVDFGGWELPVQYTGVMEEHLACRKAAGLFDVSHMGEISVEGPGAEAFLNFLVTNDVSKLAIGQAQYAALCLPSGGIVDDLVIYRRAQDRFFVVVNASNTDKDFSWFNQSLREYQKIAPSPSAPVEITNQSNLYSQIAIQGPRACEILQKISATRLNEVRTYWFIEGQLIPRRSGNPAPPPINTLIARTGYTGEDGFELYLPWDKAPEVWESLIEQGTPLGLKPCGLGARDTLRMEMKYALYGHELTEETNAIEAGLGWVVKLGKSDFQGKAALSQIKEKGPIRSLVGLKLLERGIPRQGYKLYDEAGNSQIGEITSGTQSPTLQAPIGIAYVQTPLSTPGTRVRVEIRNTKILAEIVATPFYKRPKT